MSNVYVMGDSLADVGTFGFKFTVQNSSDAAGYPVWPQIVASSFGLKANDQCNVFIYTGSTFAPNSKTGCTNYAIGGGRVVVAASNGGPANPQTISTQMGARAAAGNYSSTDLVLIDGGGNDAADLVGAYLGASTPAGIANYQAFLSQQLDATTIETLLPQTNGRGLAAGAYMKALANTFYGQIKSQVLDKGATKVGLLNAPDITLTPRFQMVLKNVAATQGASASTQLQGAIQQWISAYNSQLAANVAGDSRIALVDFYTDMTLEIAQPAIHGLTNAVDTVCPVTGLGSDGLPTYDFPTCSNSALDATTGKSAGWWNTYAFSDGFHPTPHGHRLLASSVNRALVRAGWL